MTIFTPERHKRRPDGDHPLFSRTPLSALIVLACSLSVAPSVFAYTADVSGEGVVVEGEVLNDGETQRIHTGGTVNGTTIYDGGIQNVDIGGTANNTTINGGNQNVSTGGVANGTFIYGGFQDVTIGGTTNNTTINAINGGGGQNIYGGTANNTTINIGGQNVETGGTANNTTINGGNQNVKTGGTANDTTINSGNQNVNSGGIANNTTINSGGMQSVNIGGTANNTTINGSGVQGVDNNGIANSTTVNDNGVLIVAQGGVLTGQTVVNDFGDIQFYGDTAGVLQNQGELVFQRSADYTLDFNLGGTGGLTQNSPHTLLLSADRTYSYTGDTTVKGGTLKAGGDQVFSTASHYFTEAGGTLDLDGYRQTLASLNHAGVVNFGGSGGNILTLTGDYIGNNGLLQMNTVLGEDNSVTDQLVVEGNTSGTTRVQVNNTLGGGGQTLNGIELITVNGQSDGVFTQAGRIVAGAYDYYLGRGTGGNASNWYLTNTLPPDPVDPTPPDPVNPVVPIERPEASGYIANLAAANTLFATRLHDRLGETQYIDALTGEKKVTSLWLRNEGGHNRFRDSRDQLGTQSNRYVMQLGGDIAQWTTDQSRFHLGVMGGYGNSKSKTDSRVTGYRADASVDGYSLGMYGTWQANDADQTGLYVDGWAQYSWFDNSVSGQGLASEHYQSKGVTASVESGYTVKVGENAAKNAKVFIQPKAQVTWMGVKADEHKEANGTQVSGKGDGNIQTRLGVKAFMNGSSAQDKGKDRVFQPFIEANWVHNTEDFGTQMDGVTVKQAGAGNIAELKTGVEGQLNKRVNLWGNVSQQVGDKGYSDTAVMLGVKVNF
ncbi:TPA: autotransporter outer membrane beta-barrel domain-containing protein [Yersinia enterocolitica]